MGSAMGKAIIKLFRCIIRLDKDVNSLMFLGAKSLTIQEETLKYAKREDRKDNYGTDWKLEISG